MYLNIKKKPYFQFTISISNVYTQLKKYITLSIYQYILKC